MVEDVAKIVLPASLTGGTYNLTDGCHPSFNELGNHISKQLKNNRSPFHVPEWVINIAAKLGDVFGDRFLINTIKLNKIKSDLTFDDSKARHSFAWAPSAVLDAFVVKNE